MIGAPAALAQVVPTTPGTTYLAVVGDASGGGICSGGSCINDTRGIALNYFATSADVAAMNAQITSQFANTNAQIANLGNQIRENQNFAAAVGAMHDAIPNSGDRFALRFNTAAVNGIVAGGVSASANLDDNLRLSVNYGGTQNANVVSGGLNFSFH